MNLAQFIETYQDAITQAVLRTYPPVYTARNRDEWGFDLRRLRRRPLGAQGDAIRAVAVSLCRYRGTNLVGEMGTGKTTIGAAAAHLAGLRSVLVLCPPHLVRKWQREIVATVPLARTAIVTSISDLNRLRRPEGVPLFVVMSRERAKLSYRWLPAVVERLAVNDCQLVRGEVGEPLRRLCCPACFAGIVDDEGIPLAIEDLERKKRRCLECRGPLWQADRTGPRRFPLADYVSRRMPGFFDLLIVDEQHEYKARGSAQGLAAGTLAEACGRTLTLTGTLMGGYASTLFHLLWRFSPAVRDEFAHGDEPRWVARYGIVERITKKTGDDDSFEDGRVGLNGRLGLFVTTIVGTMWAAYLFTVLAFISFPSAISSGSSLIIVAWIAQTFLQLVLLPIIIVGQNIQDMAADKRAEQTYRGAEAVLHECLQIQAHLTAQDNAIEARLDELRQLLRA